MNKQISIEKQPIKNEEFAIDLISDSVVKLNEYPVPLAQKSEIQEHVKDLERKGIIQNSSSEFSSPAFIIRKPIGNPRLVINYKKLNEITRQQHFPYPSVMNQFTGLHGSNIFSSLDLKMVTTNNPAANGKSERINKAINELIRMYGRSESKQYIEKAIESRLNKNYHTSLKCTPYELAFKVEPITNKKLSEAEYEEKLRVANKTSMDRAKYDQSEKINGESYILTRRMIRYSKEPEYQLNRTIFGTGRLESLRCSKTPASSKNPIANK